MANTTIGAVTLQGDGKSFMDDNTCRKEAMLTPLPMYLMDSHETDVFDFGGVTKVLTITGTFNGDAQSEVKTFIESIEALIQGHQDISAGYPIDLVDDTRGTIKVKILDFDSTVVEGEPLRCAWTLKLIQASENA